MSERFKLAANVLLKRRLNNLVRIDHQTEIDRDFITCAEYQLFIDEMRQQGKNRQPDHWTTEKFPDGEARKSVAGVRRSDAEEFCTWLTNREILPKFIYRLPTIQETREIAAVSQNIGCWCKDNTSFIISGITAQQWQVWQQKFSEYFVFQDKNIGVNLDRDLYRDLYRDLDFYLDLNRDLYLDLYLGYNLDLNRDLDFYRDLYLERDRDLYLDLNRDLDFYRDLYLER
ncbi:MAG: SUMF1/EgtB/PvdO family nonheme iron enzyme, partial [Cyanobacteria bacterium J06621_12]